jgi:hypothetical protein
MYLGEKYDVLGWKPSENTSFDCFDWTWPVSKFG